MLGHRAAARRLATDCNGCVRGWSLSATLAAIQASISDSIQPIEFAPSGICRGNVPAALRP